ncbi:hypothetical protein IW261DRAFT_1566143 [Armillaria novae-zelandiae]|uniref:YDG domain-containing protein n=1 Tax=Armillaria novae-zelandiae TaxID=153914 RepID=A0AA39P502_9AGAR|nr:hypothetical protein IW261DRAFT_1566143 [Armillaria novae-zelandiae]
MYTNESLSDSKQRANTGKPSERSSKDHRTRSQSNVKEREGCKTAVVNLGTPGAIKRQRVGMRYMNGHYCWKPGCMGRCAGESIVWETAWSVVLSGRNEKVDKDKGNKIRLCGEGGRSKDGKMQVKDQEYTCGNKALQNAMRSGEAIHVIRRYKLDSAYPKEWPGSVTTARTL